MKKLGYILLGFLILTQFNNCSDVEFNTATGKKNASPEPCNGCINELGLRYVRQSISFENSTSNAADILFVIDNSGSMDADLVELSLKFPNFIASIQTLDWRVCVTTTDNSGNRDLEDGRLIKFSDDMLYIQKGDAAAQTKFEALINFIRDEDTGSGNEQGVKSIHRALERNEGCFRQGASLSTVVISDEDERSDGSNLDDKNMPANLILQLQETFPNIQKAYAHHSIIIASGDAVCLADQLDEPGQTAARYGTVYEELSNLTKGIIGDICAADYSAQLSFIGDQTVSNTLGAAKIECEPVDAEGKPITDINDVVTSSTSNSPLTVSLSEAGVLIISSADAGAIEVNIGYYCEDSPKP